MEIEPQGDHEYLARFDGTETRVRVTPDVLRKVSAAVTDETRVVEFTVHWLLDRQQAADLPPMLDLDDTADPIEDYLAALRLLEGVADDVDVVIPGHGSIGGADQVHARIDQDRAYVHALRDAHAPSDPRVGPSAKDGWDWVAGVHARQLQRLAQGSERNGTPG